MNEMISLFKGSKHMQDVFYGIRKYLKDNNLAIDKKELTILLN